MLKSGHQVSIDGFLSKKHLDYLGDWQELQTFLKHPNVTIYDFEYPFAKNGIAEDGSSFLRWDWQQIRLPDLQAYDLVWSDNILDVLEQRPDSVLSGSFFWFEVLEGLSEKTAAAKAFIQQQKSLLDEYRPRMIGNQYFATEAVRHQTAFFPVGLHKFTSLLPGESGDNILLACGLGGEEEALARGAVEKIIAQNMKPAKYLFVEKKILPEKYPDWIKPADFSPAMFQSCSAVCIRPGLGTVSDALVHHCRIFSFFNNGSAEMAYNAQVIENLQLGQTAGDPCLAYQMAMDFLENSEARELQFLLTTHLRTDGVFETVRHLTGFLQQSGGTR